MAEKIEIDKTSYWQKVFAQSPANGGLYLGDLFPPTRFAWPSDTWLQRKLREKYQREQKSE